MINTDRNQANFNPNVNPIQGKLVFQSREAYKVGQDASHSFAKTILLENGAPLKVSHEDYILKFRLLKKTDGKIASEEIMLPSSLFDQARKANKVVFFKNGEKFELKLASTTRNTFDSCLAFVKNQGCNGSKLSSELVYLYEEDVPEEYHNWGNGVFLSPNAKRMQLGTSESTPLDFKDLIPISKEAKKFEGTEAKWDDQVKIFLYCSGTLDEMSHTSISLDLIVDGDRLYIHSKPKNSDSFLDERFYYINITKNTDKEKIRITLAQDSVIEIRLLCSKQERKPFTEEEYEGKFSEDLNVQQLNEAWGKEWFGDWKSDFAENNQINSEQEIKEIVKPVKEAVKDQLDDEPELTNDKCCNGKCIIL